MGNRILKGELGAVWVMDFFSSEKTALLITRKIEHVIPGLMGEAHVPGLSMTIIRDHEHFWTRSFGLGCAETGEPVIRVSVSSWGTTFEDIKVSVNAFIDARESKI